MDHHDTQASTISGEITEVFAHRFVVRTPAGSVLADLGPKGAELVVLKRGDRVELTGEQKPSELKVRRITSGDRTIEVEHKKKDEHKTHDAEPGPADPQIAIGAVTAKGFEVVGQPRRKPKHFEILGKDHAGVHVEHHVDLNGMIGKTRPVDAADQKWAEDIASAT
jgi:hypothetical protein